MRNGTTDRCAKCGKIIGHHKAFTLACPQGLKTRVGYARYSKTDTFTYANGDKKALERGKQIIREHRALRERQLMDDLVKAMKAYLEFVKERKNER